MHGGAKGSGAPLGNTNAVKHGLYSRRELLPDEDMDEFSGMALGSLDDEIRMTRIQYRRVNRAIADLLAGDPNSATGDGLAQFRTDGISETRRTKQVGIEPPERPDGGQGEPGLRTVESRLSVERKKGRPDLIQLWTMADRLAARIADLEVKRKLYIGEGGSAAEGIAGRINDALRKIHELEGGVVDADYFEVPEQAAIAGTQRE